MTGLGSVPLLIVQGSEDRIVPPPNSGRRLPALVPHEERGPAEAARQTGIPKNTTASWAKRTDW